jgi:hypothetical protein
MTGRRCRHIWTYWLGVNLALFGYLEWRGHQVGCHPTLSRDLRRWTRAARHPWTPLVFVGLGVWLAVHLIALRDDV